MTGFEVIILALLCGAVLLLAVLLLLSLKRRSSNDFDGLRSDIAKSLYESRTEMTNTVSKYIVDMSGGLRAEQQALQKTVSDSLLAVQERFHAFSLQNDRQLSDMRSTMERRLAAMQEDNQKRLEEMRSTVDEKLQKTLEDRIGQSFKMVSERLEQVYKGLGEMQTLASGVGDLKKVLSNVKTRGTLGEIQLDAILREIMAPEQYEAQCTVKQGSSERVDFAIKMPAENGEFVYLPIDAKFPMEAYHRLMDAYDSGEQDLLRAAAQELARTIKGFAKDISAKYINPPATTDFAIMFLPVEGLYAEVVRSGLMEQLQREFRVSIAGPTTISALLNSLQMGFRTLAIQKRSGEVWQVLGAVKTEFDKFGKVLANAQKQIDSANRDIDLLIGTRMKVMERRLRGVTALPQTESELLLEQVQPPEMNEGSE